MGLLDKLKKRVGKTGVKLEWIWVENPFPFNDPMIKATILVKAESETITVEGLKGTFVAKRPNGDSNESITLMEEIQLGQEIQRPNKNHSTERKGEHVPVYPCVLEKGEEERFGYFVSNMDLKTALAKWGVHDPASAKEKGIRFFFTGEVDIKETVGLFDPRLEIEIEVK